MFGLASRYGSYEVTYKALTYPPHTFDDPKIEKQKMVVDAEDNLDAKRIAEKTLKGQGYNFCRIYDSKLLKYKSKPTKTANKQDSNSKLDWNTDIKVPKKFLYFLLGVCGVIIFLVIALLIMIEIFV